MCTHALSSVHSTTALFPDTPSQLIYVHTYAGVFLQGRVEQRSMHCSTWCSFPFDVVSGMYLVKIYSIKCFYNTKIVGLSKLLCARRIPQISTHIPNQIRGARERNDALTRQRKEALEGKLQRAEKQRESHLLEIKRKAQEEEAKVCSLSLSLSLSLSSPPPSGIEVLVHDLIILISEHHITSVWMYVHVYVHCLGEKILLMRIIIL